ncbi:MAG: hypothetical protein ACE37H_09505 [Phycisphaeraceae bacterium]
MYALRTVILEHTDVNGVHFDWLIEDPTLADPQSPEARLWAARVPAPPAHWPALGRFDARVIAPHRRRYLGYQGPISDGRGRVRRVAAGTCVALLWTRSRILLNAQLAGVHRSIALRHVGGSGWVCVVQ